MNISPLRRKSVAEATGHATPERAALAFAIAAAAEASGRRQGLVQAARTAVEAVHDAKRVVEEAAAAVDQAKEAEVRHRTDVARGLSSAAPSMIRDARVALAVAEEELDTWQTTLAALKAEMIQDVESYKGYERNRVKEAAEVVIRSEALVFARDLTARLTQMQRDVVAMGSAFRWLADAGVFPLGTEAGNGYGQPSEEEIRKALWRLHQTPQQWANSRTRHDEPFFAIETGKIAWDAALEALMKDANAPLPVAGNPT